VGVALSGRQEESQLKKYQKIICGFWMVALFAGPAWAEGGGEAAQESGKLGVMTVTASKMNATLKDEPQSLTVIDDVMLEERRITDIQGVIRQVPNMYMIEGIANTESSVRGLNISMHSLTNPVVLYLDGIPIANRYGYDIPLVNVERVEVLRGPQGTLYGKDAIGGVINVVTKRSGAVWEGDVGAETGNYNTYRLTFAANGPLVHDLLYAGLWGSLDGDDGWIENEHPGRDNAADDEDRKRLGLNLLLTPTANFSARLQMMRDDRHKGFTDGGMIPVGAYDAGAGWFAPAPIAAFNHADRDDFEDADYDVDTFADTTVDAQGLHLEYDSALGTFVSITTHHKAEVDGCWDVDYAYVDPVADPFRSFVFNDQAYYDESKHETFSQELRWSRELDSGMRWVAGLYYEHQDVDYENFALQMFNTDYRFVSKNGSESRALFGQVVLPFLGDFELTLGGRYQRVDKDIDLDSFVTSIGDPLGPPAYELNADDSWTTFLPKAALSYRINDAWTVYAGVARGYIPGGFNFAASSANVEDNSFDPQQSLNYEIGAKAGLLGGRLFFSAAAFYLDITDIHVFSIENNVAVTSNAAEASSYGLELEADFQISKRWQANVALGVIRAEYGDYIDNNGNDNDGNKVQKTPAHSLNFGLQYTDPSGFYGRVDVINYGTVYFDATNALKQDPYTLVNLKAGYLADNWELYAYADNITDTDYKTFGQSGAPAGILVEFGDPVTFGVGAKYRF
jgi:iron complex outermembrane recepter protein